MNILTTYFPDRDPPYPVYYRQILEQIELAEELCMNLGSHEFNYIVTSNHIHLLVKDTSPNVPGPEMGLDSGRVD